MFNHPDDCVLDVFGTLFYSLEGAKPAEFEVKRKKIVLKEAKGVPVTFYQQGPDKQIFNHLQDLAKKSGFQERADVF